MTSAMAVAFHASQPGQHKVRREFPQRHIFEESRAFCNSRPGRPADAECHQQYGAPFTTTIKHLQHDRLVAAHSKSKQGHVTAGALTPELKDPIDD